MTEEHSTIERAAQVAPRRITVIGLGAMGQPMAARLAAKGFGVVAVDPSTQARARADHSGITSFPDVASAPAADVVVVLVATGAQLLDTAKDAVTRRGVEGETWFLCSTVGPQAARDAAQILTDGGATVVDAPVTGGVPGAEQGTLRFLAAGDPAALERYGDVLAVLGEVAFISAQPGDGQATKLVNQLCSSVHLAAAAEAIALSTRLGLDPVTTVQIIRGGSGASWFFDERGPRMAELGVEPEVFTRLSILSKDNGLVEQEADAHGAHVPLLKAAKGQYRRAAELGLLDADDSQLIRTYLD
jgi:3-hydroxyisobutyrate dehydrogenase